MAITDEITQVIRDRIQNFQGPSAESTTTSVGTVIDVADGIARVYGLSGVRYLELRRVPAHQASLASPSTSKRIPSPCRSWATIPSFTKTTRCAPLGASSQVPVGDALIGRVVNALGEPMDDAGPISTTSSARSSAWPLASSRANR